MYIYKLTQEYVKVRKLGQDFKDFIWRGLRIRPHEKKKIKATSPGLLRKGRSGAEK